MELTKRSIVETIVVEGRDDLINLRRCIDADIIVTDGYHIRKKTLLAINEASKKNGVIIFTDPDRAGDLIRKRVESACEGSVKHAYITRDEAIKSGDLGVENASVDAITSALSMARVKEQEQVSEFCQNDLYALGLSGSSDAAKNRVFLCDKLRIQRSNSKSLLRALNSYGISKNEVETIMEEISDR